MIRAFFGLLGAGMMLAGAAQAQTYQVGQYLGNLNDAGRFAYNTMGGAAHHATYSPGATWSTLAGQNAARMAGTATATIGGRTVPLTLISRVPVPAIFNGLRAAAAMNPTTAAVTLLGGLALNHWLEQSQIEWNTDPATYMLKPYVEVYPVGGVEYRFPGWSSPDVGWSRTRSAACSMTRSNYPSLNIVEGPRLDNDGGCVFWTAPVNDPGNRAKNGPSWPETRTSTQEERRPISWEEAEPLMTDAAAKDYGAVDWKGITEQLLRKGGSIDPSQITSTVSGPASQTGERTVTTGKNAQGEPTTTTKTTTHNYTYNNNNVTHNTTTTTTTINNITNEVENETTEETENKPDDTATDSPLPEVPELYERKYPDGLKGVWDTKSAAIMQSPLFSLASGMVPTIGDGGCPQWSLAVDIGIIDFGVYDISLPCNVWAFVRIVILITALFLVRRLIFGG